MWKIISPLRLKERALCDLLVDNLFDVDCLVCLCKAALAIHEDILTSLEKDLPTINDALQNSLEDLSTDLVKVFDKWTDDQEKEKAKQNKLDLARASSFGAQDKPLPQPKRKCEAVPRLVTPDEMKLPLDTVRM